VNNKKEIIGRNCLVDESKHQNDFVRSEKLYVISRYYVILLVILCGNVFAQTSRINNEIINSYARVVAISGRTVTLSSDASLMFNSANLPDTVLLIQMTGISTNGAINNAGRYEFNIVEAISGQNVTLRAAPLAFNTNEIVQLIRVPSYRNAEIVAGNTLTCKEWNWATGTGGVLALMVEGTLTLNASIDVSNRGFRGGAATTVDFISAGGVCGFGADHNHPNTFPNHPANATNRAGNKGEGAVMTSFFNPGTSNLNIRGFGRIANGGGGGAGQWSGGGGGGNGNSGGVGGAQSCGALAFSDGIEAGNNGFPFAAPFRLFMGGGGGAGTGIGTAGGNGGGIVIIVANALRFAPGTAIRANGGSVEGAPPKAGAGGGGAGGSVLIWANDYDDNNIRVEIMGGNGGNVDGEGVCRNVNFTQGAGGGGSGGVLLTSRDENIFRDWYENTNRFRRNGGNRGNIINVLNNCDVQGVAGNQSLPGNTGTFFGNIQLPLNGFLLNYIFAFDTVMACYDEPTTIRASAPQSGTGVYEHRWERSANGNVWTPIQNSVDNLTFRFIENIYVRRVVTSGALVDFSRPVFVSVYDPISNNITTIDDVICWSESFVIRGNNPTGGGGDGERYDISWLIFENSDWRHIDNGVNMTALLPQIDGTGTYSFQRVVTSSKGCVSSTVTAEITVQPAIRDNIITPEIQEVCVSDYAERLNGLIPQNRNGVTYQWQISNNGDDWVNIDAFDYNYQPDLSIQNYGGKIIRRYFERFYRRLVTSGVCESESNVVMVRFDEEPSPHNIITEEAALGFQFSTALEAAVPFFGNGTWSSDDLNLIFTTPNEPITTVRNLKLGENTVYWTVRNGACVLPPQSIEIYVKNVVIPSGFSPNGDGINDCFRVKYGENARTAELIIFDRFNNIVFESNSFIGSGNLNDCAGWWDGRDSSGRELPSGTYFYQLILNNDFRYRGYVVLKR